MSNKSGLITVAVLILLGFAVGAAVIFTMQSNQEMSYLAQTVEANHNATLAAKP